MLGQKLACALIGIFQTELRQHGALGMRHVAKQLEAQSILRDGYLTCNVEPSDSVGSSVSGESLGQTKGQ